MRPFQEEKLTLALFHHHLLQDFWAENLGARSLKLLRQLIPMSWIMDPTPLPPGAVLDGPRVGDAVVELVVDVFDVHHRSGVSLLLTRGNKRRNLLRILRSKSIRRGSSAASGTLGRALAARSKRLSADATTLGGGRGMRVVRSPEELPGMPGRDPAS